MENPVPATFQAGDLVQLKSGGPVMTVARVGDDSLGRALVWCVWFDSKKTQKTSTFQPETLEKVTE